MKRIVPFILSLALVFSLYGCGNFHEPTHQQETAATPSPPAKPSLEIISQQIILCGDGKTSTYLAEIKNTNDFPVRVSDVSIELETGDGTLVKVLDYITASPKIVDAGKSIYICEAAVTLIDTDIDASTVTSAKLNLSADKSTMPDLPVEVTEINLSTKIGYPNIVGRAENTGSEDLSLVCISVPLYSSEGELQTVFTTYVDIKAEGTVAFDQMAIHADPDADYSGSILGEISICPLY